MSNNENFNKDASINQRKKAIYELSQINRVIPPVGIFDDPVRCYKINQEWARIVIGFTAMLAQPELWGFAENEMYLPIQEILKFLEGVPCGTDETMILRQNPENDCQLEYSTDEGETWILAFDYSLCVPEFAETLIQNSTEIINQNTANNINSTVNNFTNTIWNNYVNNYIDSITDIAPDLGYGDSDDSFRDAALCHALGEFVDSVCAAALAYFDELDNTANDLRTSLALAAAIIGIVALAATGVGALATGPLAASAAALATQAGLWGAGIALGSALGGSLFDHFTETNREPYEDDEAKQAVVCCLLDTLKGANLDRDDFIAAFTCGGLSDNAQSIHDACAIFAQEDATYAALVENLRIGYNSAKVGILGTCDCPYPSMVEYDFSEGNKGFAGDPATYNNAGYWDGVTQVVFPATSTLVVAHINKLLGANAKVMGIGFQYTAETNCGITSMGANVLLDGVSVGGFSSSPIASGTTVYRTYGTSIVGSHFDGDEIEVIISSRLCPPQATIARLFKVRVWLHPESEIKGVEVPALPYGTGANGTSDSAWWT
jgi:hypothetical protein